MNAIEKYTKILEEKDMSYAVYKYISQQTKLEKIKEYIGKYHNQKEDKFNCILCCKGTSKYKEDKYMEALVKLYEK